jgi:hypothetical protein
LQGGLESLGGRVRFDQAERGDQIQRFLYLGINEAEH